MKNLLILNLALLALPLAAQTAPAGWKFTEDKSTNASDPDGAGAIKMVTAGAGYHIETPTAAVFWNPANTATGNYTLKATFTLNERSGHVNFYGLVFGGKDLGTANLTYNYFLIAQDNPPGARFGGPQPLGSFLIKTMKGTAATPVFNLPGRGGRSGAAPHEAIKVPNAAGKATNTLEVRVQAATVEFVVNGTVLYSAPREGLNTDGVWGIRSNHLLNINVESLSVTKQ